ncbi:MAG: hypothetical protein ACI9XB_005152 [Gammaproteobacteria bacterium]|jgi:hypothetical protein
MKMSSDKMITEKEGYEAMLYMLEAYWKLTDSNEITDILSGGSYLDKDTPGDSAFWEYWLEAIEKVKKEGSPPIMELT